MTARAPRVVVNVLVLSLGAVFGVAVVSCREEAANPQSSALTVVEATLKKQSDILIFPDELRVADESVNEFVTRAMNTCAAGEYDAFRLLWSVQEDPLPRGDFEQGWQAVELIRIRALEKARLVVPPGNEANTIPPDHPAGTVAATEEARAVPKGVYQTAPDPGSAETGEEGETVYLILADVRLDPEHPAGKQQASREVALMLVLERGQWRIANPPKVMREWLRKKAEARDKKKARPQNAPADPGTDE